MRLYYFPHEGLNVEDMLQVRIGTEQKSSQNVNPQQAAKLSISRKKSADGLTLES